MSSSRVLSALLLCAALLPACGGWFGPSKSARGALFECRVEALKPIAGEVYDVEYLVREVYAHRMSLAAVVASVNATRQEVQTMLEALAACDPQPSDAGAPPAPEATEPTEL